MKIHFYELQSVYNNNSQLSCKMLNLLLQNAMSEFFKSVKKLKVEDLLIASLRGSDNGVGANQKRLKTSTTINSSGWCHKCSSTSFSYTLGKFFS